MASTPDLTVAQHIKDRILDAAGDSVLRILFFGSRVVNRGRPTSDYDILVVLRDPVPSPAQESVRLSNLFSDFDHPVDVHVFGESEFEECRPVAATVAYPAERAGVVLFSSV